MIKHIILMNTLKLIMKNVYLFKKNTKIKVNILKI
jgi:hypothetical protein